MPTSLYMTYVNLRPHPLSWSESAVGVVLIHRLEEEAPIVGAVLSADEKHGGTLMKEIGIRMR